MAVGAKGSLGKPMLRRGEQISIKVRRSLRDVFRKVPTFSLEIKVIFFLIIYYLHFASSWSGKNPCCPPSLTVISVEVDSGGGVDEVVMNCLCY